MSYIISNNMEKKYKLKKEARQFFDSKLHKEVNSHDFWIKNAVTTPLLEEVGIVHIEYGSFPKELGKGSKSTSLCGHDGNKKLSHFEFTVYVNGMDWQQYEQVNDSTFLAKWMDELQKTTDKLIQSKIQ